MGKGKNKNGIPAFNDTSFYDILRRSASKFLYLAFYSLFSRLSIALMTKNYIKLMLLTLFYRKRFYFIQERHSSIGFSM